MSASGSDHQMDSTEHSTLTDSQDGTSNGDRTSDSLPQASNSTATAPPSAHSVEKGAEAESTPTPTHSVGKEQAPAEEELVYNDSELSESSDSESSTDSASSPSDDNAGARSERSASSPSDAESGPPAFLKTYRIPKNPESLTNARTIDELQRDCIARYNEGLVDWDKNVEGREPPIAFTEGWYNHKFCRSFVYWYRIREPTVRAREEEDRRQAQAEADAILGPSTSSTSAEHAAVPEEQAAQLLQDALPPAETVPSVKPTKNRPPRTASAHSADKSTSARAAPTHSVGPSATAKKGEEQRKTIADLKRRGDPSTSHHSRSNTGSKRSHKPSSSSRHPPAKEARHMERTRSSPPTPNMARHLDRVAKAKCRHLTPILDGYVSKDVAVYVALHGHREHPWVPLFLNPEKKYELLGLINHFGVPASYLRIEHCNPTRPGDHTPLASQTYDQLFVEKAIIPWDFILGSTLGALPPYYRQCVRTTRRHLTDSLEKSDKYRDIDVCGIGPTGFDLRNVPAKNTKEYEEQRLNLIEFAKIARDLRKGLVVMVYFDENSPHADSVHRDAIRTLQKEGISSSQPIHLIFNRASALELTIWLEAFPRTLIGLTYEYISNVRTYIGQHKDDPTDEGYLYARASRDLLEFIPLVNIALHSGCPEPKEPEAMKFHHTPYDVTTAATELHLLTGTTTEVIHVNNATNLVKFYRLDHRLLDNVGSKRDYHHERLHLDELADKIYDLFGGRPRAAHNEQEQEQPADRASAEAMDHDAPSSPIASRSRSPRRDRQPRKDRSPSDRRSSDRRSRSSKQEHKEHRHRSPPTHSVGRKSEKERSSTRSSSRRHPAKKRDSSPPSRRHRSSSQKEPKFVVNMDLDPGALEKDFPKTQQEADKPSSSKSVMDRLGTVGQPAPLLFGPRLAGRVAQCGKILPSQPTVRETIQNLKKTHGDDPPPTVRQQLKALRRQQAQTPTHSVGAAAHASATAHSAGAARTTIRCPDMRLLQIPPEYEVDMAPPPPTAEDIYSDVLQYLSKEPDADTGLRHVECRLLASTPIEPAQPELFQVPAPGEELCPLDPFYECHDDNEHPDFHRTTSAFSLVTDGYWKNKKGMKTPENQALLEEVKQLKVSTLMQMVYLKYGTRLRSNHPDRTPNALRFIREVLLAANPRQDLPQILHRLKPTFTNEKTRDAWPAPIDYQRALDHWVCYCTHAGIYVMNHLSGPIVYNPDWFQEGIFPQEVRETFGVDLANDGPAIVHELRHQVYRQYGLEHIKAIAERRKDFTWRRFDDMEHLRIPLGLELTQPVIIFADQHTWKTYQHGLRFGVEMISVDTTSLLSALDDVRQYFPRQVVEKIVFWFGFDYLHNGNCYGRALAEVCYHYSKFFGQLKQYAVLPPYIRNLRQAWTDSALTTFVQQKELLPFARVAIGPMDLRAWERDERDLQSPDGSDGNFLNNVLVEATKLNLATFHDLDLWGEEAICPSTGKPTKPSSAQKPPTQDHHMSSAEEDRPSTSSRTIQMPSTSGAHPAPALDPNRIAAALAEQLLAQGTTSAGSAIETAAFITERALSIAAQEATRAVSPRLDDVDQLVKKSVQKDHHRHSRKDHGPRK